jgi:hypothetical protein
MKVHLLCLEETFSNRFFPLAKSLSSFVFADTPQTALQEFAAKINSKMLNHKT